MADIGFANVEVLSAANTKVLAINNTRVSLVKGYGLMTPIATFEVAVSDILNALDIPSVKHGKWESSQRTIETGTVYCSNCAIEYYIFDLQTVGDCNGIVHYCPNCGARMDGDTE